ncbi:MAG: hypothetical protein KBC67_02170 [Candidatus Pacebacteria bacterium]|nr:hypothetical protein [Candidatus Paceibacterota bacterium]
MVSESFLKRVLMFIGFILSGLITLIFISTPESLQVPVPDSVPTITTKSSLAREFDEAKLFFESSIKTQIPGSSLASVVSWSPNSKYILANLRFIDPSGGTTRPYIMDLSRKLYVVVPNATWIDAASWSGTKIAYVANNGYSYFDVETNESATFGSPVSAGPVVDLSTPVISGDGAYIAYNAGGLAVYSLKASKSIQLNQHNDDVPLLWKSDDKTLLISTGAGAERSLSEFHIGTRALRTIAALPQSISRAKWVAKDQLALLTLGFDDGYFDYAANLKTNSLSLLAETTEGIAFTSAREREMATLKGNKITLYGSEGEKKIEAKRTDKSRISNFELLPSPLALFVREQGDAYDVATFNMTTLIETAVEDIWLPYVIVSPNGKSAVTVKEGNDSAQFVDLPNAS